MVPKALHPITVKCSPKQELPSELGEGMKRKSDFRETQKEKVVTLPSREQERAFTL